MSDFEIGTTLVGMTNLAALETSVREPRSSYAPFTSYASLGNGTVRGLGFPAASWYFGVITVEERSQLAEFCPGASAQVYIRTKLPDDTYADFEATMVWPEEEERFAGGHKADLRITFRNLVVVEAS